MGEPYTKAIAKAESEGIDLPNTAEHLKTQASLFLLKPPGWEPPPPPSWFSPTPPEDKPKETYYVPSRYLPSFWPLFSLGVIATLHALVMLLQVWMVDFKCWVRYRLVNTVSQATHVKVRESCSGGDALDDDNYDGM